MSVIVPPSDHPELSVVIVLHGGGALAVEAVASLVAHTEVPFEVIVVDNHSPDDSVLVFQRAVDGVLFLAESENLGFGPANNLAAERARAPFVCLFNPDARATTGWLPPLLEYARRDEVGAVAPALVDERGILREAGAVVDHWGFTAPPRGRSFAEPIPEPAGPSLVDYASAACLLLRTTTFREIGGFDPAYRFAYYEDVDLAFRLWDRGYQVWCVPESRVLHLHGESSDSSGREDLWHRNRSVFLTRWSAELQARPALSDPSADLGRLAVWREPVNVAMRAEHPTGTKSMPDSSRSRGRLGAFVSRLVGRRSG